MWVRTLCAKRFAVHDADAALHEEVKAGKVRVGNAERQIKERAKPTKSAVDGAAGNTTPPSTGGGRHSPSAREKQSNTLRSNKAVAAVPWIAAV